MKRPVQPLIAVLALLAIFTALYFLSVAPARILVEKGSLSQGIYLTVYSPLLDAPVVGDWVRLYARYGLSLADDHR